MRDYIDYLEKQGALITIEEELDTKYEVSAVLRAIGEADHRAVLIKNVKGYQVPVVGNLLENQENLALSLGQKKGNFWDEYRRRLQKPVAPVLTRNGAVQDVVISDGIDILKTIPVLTNNKRDISPYITQGVIFVKDPDSGRTTMGIHRLQVKGKDKLGYYVSSGSVTSAKFLQNATKAGRPLAVAVALGVEPAVYLSAFTGAIPTPVLNKLELAGGLREEPIKVVKAKTSDLEVPADAMFIIEGEIPPGIREPDGPFGEVCGYYIPSVSPIINIKTITHQKNPMYSAAAPYTTAENDIHDVMIHAQLKGLLSTMVPAVRDVAIHFKSALAIISIEKRNAWDSRNALYHCLTTFWPIKFAIVVDEDIDVNNPLEVGVALAGRCEPQTDTVTVQDVQGFELHPAVREGNLTGKLGLDATVPLGEQEKYEIVNVPKEAAEKAAQIVRNYL